MTSIHTHMVGVATGNRVAAHINGLTYPQTATGKTVSATYPTRFRTATAQAWTASVGDYVWFIGEGIGTGGRYYGYAVMSQKNATVDGVAAQDEYILVGPWQHKDASGIGTVPPTTATFTTYRFSTGAQPATPHNSWRQTIIESIVCTRNTTAGAGTLTVTELANTASGYTATPIVFSVPTAASFVAVTVPLPTDGLVFDGPVVFSANANTSDWVIQWRGAHAISLTKSDRWLFTGGRAL